MKTSLISIPVVLAAMLLGIIPSAAKADMPRPDDAVIFDLSAEDWVTTKTARVDVSVEAAVTSSNAGKMRADMLKAVGDVAQADWKLTAFNRSQDQTGLERWSATFEARVPEAQLGGLNDNAKKASKAGMQLTVSETDFTPTLEEVQAAQSQLRAKIVKDANDQLATLNAELPGRGYRVGMINFTGENMTPMFHPMMAPRGMNKAMVAMASPPMPPESDAQQPPEMEVANKITVTARVMLSASPPTSTR